MPNAILDPTGATQASQATTATTATKPRPKRAPRRKDLNGATIGLLVNTKQNAAPFLDEIGRLLTQRHGAACTIART